MKKMIFLVTQSFSIYQGIDFRLMDHLHLRHLETFNAFKMEPKQTSTTQTFIRKVNQDWISWELFSLSEF